MEKLTLCDLQNIKMRLGLGSLRKLKDMGKHFRDCSVTTRKSVGVCTSKGLYKAFKKGRIHLIAPSKNVYT